MVSESYYFLISARFEYQYLLNKVKENIHLPYIMLPSFHLIHVNQLFISSGKSISVNTNARHYFSLLINIIQ